MCGINVVGGGGGGEEEEGWRDTVVADSIPILSSFSSFCSPQFSSISGVCMW